VGPAGPAGGGTGTSSRAGERQFSEFGTFAALDAWMAKYGSSGFREEIKWGAADYTMDAQLGLRSGHRLKGTDLPSREYGTGTRWRAKSGTTSFFKKIANSQGYPSDGSVRDFTVSGIEFYGSTPVLPANNVDSGSYSGNTQWYTEFRDCGFVGTPLMAGWGDGFHVTGNTHVQAISDTWVTCGGSENSLFTGDSISFLDSAANLIGSTGKPFIRMFSTMWTIGDAMISCRKNCYQVLVSGGGNGRIIGTYFDAPAAERTQPPQLNVTGGRSLSVTNASFHNGTVGIQLAGGSGTVIVDNCIFDDETGPPVVMTAGFTGRLKIGYNCFVGSTPKEIKVNSLSQVIGSDPELTVRDLNGYVLQAAAR
jgi:hypothetical protein